MRVLDAARRHPIAAASAAGALLGAVIGLFLPIRAPDAPKSDAAGWDMPTAQSLKRFHLDQYQEVRSARFWGDLASPGTRSNTASGWTLSAIVTRPVLRVAVQIQGKRETTWVQPGGALPDGARLVSATRDAIRFEKDGCVRERALYQVKNEKAAADACIDGTPAKPAAGASTPGPAAQPKTT